MDVPNEQEFHSEKKEKNTGAFDDIALRKFIESNKDFFDLDNGYKVGIFAVGVLVRQVFNYQSRNLEYSFREKIKRL